VPFVVVGNNSETPPELRQVTHREGKQLAEEFQCAFVEASSRYNKNVGHAFELMIAQIEKLNEGSESEPVASSSCTIM
jgi:Ras family protein